MQCPLCILLSICREEEAEQGGTAVAQILEIYYNVYNDTLYDIIYNLITTKQLVSISRYEEAEQAGTAAAPVLDIYYNIDIMIIYMIKYKT